MKIFHSFRPRMCYFSVPFIFSWAVYTHTYTHKHLYMCIIQRQPQLQQLGAHDTGQNHNTHTANTHQPGWKVSRHAHSARHSASAHTQTQASAELSCVCPDLLSKYLLLHFMDLTSRSFRIPPSSLSVLSFLCLYCVLMCPIGETRCELAAVLVHLHLYFLMLVHNCPFE